MGKVLPGEVVQRVVGRLDGSEAGADVLLDDRRGAVREGLDADATLVGEDLLEVPLEALRAVPVLGTVVAGRRRA